MNDNRFKVIYTGKVNVVKMTHKQIEEMKKKASKSSKKK